MSTAVLNISLDDKVAQNVTIDRRYAVVRAALRLCFSGVAGEIQDVSYTSPDGPVQEHCGVFTIEYDATHEVFENAVYGISRSLGQDCIAVLFENGLGACIGPHADRWPFNPSFFHLPGISRALAAA